MRMELWLSRRYCKQKDEAVFDGGVPEMRASEECARSCQCFVARARGAESTNKAGTLGLEISNFICQFCIALKLWELQSRNSSSLEWAPGEDASIVKSSQECL